MHPKFERVHRLDRVTPGSRLALLFIERKKIPKDVARKDLEACGITFLSEERQQIVIKHAKSIARDYKRFRTARDEWEQDVAKQEASLPKREKPRAKPPAPVTQSKPSRTRAPKPDRPDTPEGQGNDGSRKRELLFGHPPTAVLRAMGKKGWTIAQASAALECLGITVAECTIKIQVRAGEKGQRGAPADLSKAQWKELQEACNGVANS